MKAVHGQAATTPFDSLDGISEWDTEILAVCDASLWVS